MDKKDRLVLTGVRVANFLNIAIFDLIFLLSIYILSVWRFVGLYVIFSVSPVCLSVCLMYSTVQYLQGYVSPTFLILQILT